MITYLLGFIVCACALIMHGTRYYGEELTVGKYLHVFFGAIVIGIFWPIFTAHCLCELVGMIQRIRDRKKP